MVVFLLNGLGSLINGIILVGTDSRFSVFPGIRQLQLILLKVALLLGVEVHTGVEFQGLIEPSGESGIDPPVA